MSEPSLFILPYPKLTPIKGAPTNRSIKLLKKQLFANTRAVHSTRGGGGMHGHMALLLSKIGYLDIAGSAFNLPIHPSDAPTHTVGSSNAQIAETSRQYNAKLSELKTYHGIHATLKQQNLTAVSHLFLNTLEDDLMGYSDVNAVDMLKHLTDKYASITSDNIKRNRATLSPPWNPNTDIEDLWLCINCAQLFSLDANEDNTYEISTAAAAIRLTLAMFEKEQLFITYCNTWCDRDKDKRTLTVFQDLFKKANKGRLGKLTADQAGYHGAANAALGVPSPVINALPTELRLLRVRFEALKSVRKTLKKHPAGQQVIHAIQQWTKNPTQTPILIMTTTNQYNIQQMCKEQSLIGWDNLF